MRSILPVPPTDLPCDLFPLSTRVKFLATFLSRVNQHEAAVLANKFPNLHLYGCWWYCNNPSIIREVRPHTQTRGVNTLCSLRAPSLDARPQAGFVPLIK
jgi:hypothetical protein